MENMNIKMTYDSHNARYDYECESCGREITEEQSYDPHFYCEECDMSCLEQL